MRTCVACNELKVPDLFEGGRRVCRACRNEYRKQKMIARGQVGRDGRLRRLYGMLQSDYDRMLSEQSGVCKICKGVAPNRWGSSLVIDHCHKSGKVRGLLCMMCNKGLGHFGDEPEFLVNAAKYLKGSA